MFYLILLAFSWRGTLVGTWKWVIFSSRGTWTWEFLFLEVNCYYHWVIVAKINKTFLLMFQNLYICYRISTCNFLVEKKNGRRWGGYQTNSPNFMGKISGLENSQRKEELNGSKYLFYKQGRNGNLKKITVTEMQRKALHRNLVSSL